MPEQDAETLATIIDVSGKANGDIQATYETAEGSQWRGTLSVEKMEFTKEGFREFREALKGTEVRKPW